MSKESGAAAKPLGNDAIIRTPPESGEDEPGAEAMRRRRRYALQRHASYLLKDMRRVNRKGQLVPYRVTSCLWSKGFQQNGVVVSKTVQGSAYKSGLQICGSIWHCPVCAARISNERRRNIKAGQVAAGGLGYKVVLMTLTARHDGETDLLQQLEAMTKAYEAMWRGAPAERIKARYGILGIIRSLEATHSKRNGWHPHLHAILFVREDADIEALGCDLRARWEHCAARYGLTMNEHGFDLVDDTQKVADYIAKYGHEPKWQSADELARWHTKIGRGRGEWEHFTPWQLLEFSYNGDAAAGDLFREYARVFYRRRQVVWSDGLRDALGLGEELSDEEAAQKEMDAPELLSVYCTWEQWLVIRGNDARAEYLEIIEKQETAAGIQAECMRWFGFAPWVTEPGAAGPESEADFDGG